MVEEAGQVLEAHILASLVPSGTFYTTSVWLRGSPLSDVVEHLICIGDPQQLRPTVSTFSESPALVVTKGLTLWKPCQWTADLARSCTSLTAHSWSAFPIWEWPCLKSTYSDVCGRPSLTLCGEQYDAFDILTKNLYALIERFYTRNSRITSLLAAIHPSKVWIRTFSFSHIKTQRTRRPTLFPSTTCLRCAIVWTLHLHYNSMIPIA